MMTTISPLERIAIFNYRVLQTPATIGALQPLKELFAQLQKYSTDPACAKELNKTRVLFELKEEQATLAAKVEKVLNRWKLLQKTAPKASPENYEELSHAIEELKKDVEGLQKDLFPVNASRQAILSRLEILNRFVESHNPSAWKTQAVFQATIGAGIGLFFANMPKAMEGALVSLNGIATSYFDSSICKPDSCVNTASPNAILGTALLIGVSGVLIANTVSKVRKLATPLLSKYTTPLLQKTYTWATADQTPAALPAKEGRPQLENLSSSPMTLDHVPLPPLSPAKQSAYDKLTGGKAPADWLHITSHSLADPSAVLDSKVFSHPKQPVEEKSGSFAFPASAEEVEHWTVNFSNPHLLGHIDEPLLGQEELLTLEHPVLVHLRSLLDTIPSLDLLAGEQIALISHVGRYGSLNGAHLEHFEKPTFSNLFAIAAPQHPGFPGEPVQRGHLKELFVKSCTAFSAIANRAEDSGKRAIAHTGNWDNGPLLAAALCQMLAARIAGVEIYYYPAGRTDDFAKAKKILADLEAKAPNACIGEILVHLAAHAKEYGIVYGACLPVNHY